MKEITVQDFIDAMIQEYDIIFSDIMTPTEYKKRVLKDIDKYFEIEYNIYKEEEKEED